MTIYLKKGTSIELNKIYTYITSPPSVAVLTQKIFVAYKCEKNKLRNVIIFWFNKKLSIIFLRSEYGSAMQYVPNLKLSKDPFVVVVVV